MSGAPTQDIDALVARLQQVLTYVRKCVEVAVLDVTGISRTSEAGVQLLSLLSSGENESSKESSKETVSLVVTHLLQAHSKNGQLLHLENGYPPDLYWASFAVHEDDNGDNGDNGDGNDGE